MMSVFALRNLGSALALLVASNVFVLPATVSSARADTPAVPWPQADSDLAPDAAIKFGTLANGMRYAILKNATPARQVSIRMRVASGSREEADNQQGLAHFLEHMAFKGSAHVPGDDMIKILQRHGLAFGPDTNASTEFNQTVYQLDLPENDDDTVDTSLLLMRETAGELTLDAKAFNDERGVILSEERTRDTPQYRALLGWMNLAFDGQRVSERLPIGKVDVIKNAPVDLVRDYYHAFYRPERTTLIVTGDVDPQTLEAKIKARFSDWQATGPAKPEPELGAVAARGTKIAVSEVAGSQTSIDITWARPIDTGADTAARRSDRMIALIGLTILKNRYDTLKDLPNPPFLAASVNWRNAFSSARLLGIGIDTAPDGWQKGMTAAVEEQRRLLQFGPSQIELDRVIKDLRTSLENSAAAAATRRTRDLASQFDQSLDDGEVYTSPTSDLDLFNQIAAKATLPVVNAALAKVFGGAGPLVLLTTAKAPEGGEAAVKSVYDKANSSVLSAGTQEAKLVWPYTSFGTPGAVVERKEIADLGLTMVRFANGVGLIVKPTDFQKQQVLVATNIGRGRIDLPKDGVNPFWADTAMIGGGLKALSVEDVNKSLSGSVIGGNFGVSDHAFQLSGTTRTEDLGRQLEVLAAFATEPAFRESAIEKARANYLQGLIEVTSTAVGVLGRDLQSVLHNGDARWTYATKAQMETIPATDMQKILQPILTKGEVDIVIVGDVNVDEAIRQAARTFGALPPRRDPPLADGALAMQFPAPTAEPVLRTHKGRADQAAALIAWPAPDFFADMPRSYAIFLLNEIVQERLRQQIRLAEGASYTIGNNEDLSSDFPNYGYVYDYVETPPAKVKNFFDDIEKIVSDIKANGVSADELERAKKPLLESAKTKLTDNSQWLVNLLGARKDPRLLEIPRHRFDYYERATTADIQKIAGSLLDSSKAYRMVVMPEAAQAVQ